MSTRVSPFFFSSRRRHTRSLCDWSSDVCSSDLHWCRRFTGNCCGLQQLPGNQWNSNLWREATDWKSVVEGKRVDLGGRRFIKKKNIKVRVKIVKEYETLR